MGKNQQIQFQPKSDWWENTAGFVIFPFIPWLATATEFYDNRGNSTLANWLFILATGLLVYGVYCVWTENRFVSIYTQLNRKENLKMVETTLRELKWKIRHKTAESFLADIPVLGANVQEAIIKVEEGRVLINVKHLGVSSKGRLPFFFGLNKKRTRQFCRKISSYNTAHALSFG